VTCRCITCTLFKSKGLGEYLAIEQVVKAEDSCCRLCEQPELPCFPSKKGIGLAATPLSIAMWDIFQKSNISDDLIRAAQLLYRNPYRVEKDSHYLLDNIRTHPLKMQPSTKGVIKKKYCIATRSTLIWRPCSLGRTTLLPSTVPTSKAWPS